MVSKLDKHPLGKEIRHGTIYAYLGRGCRCEDCRLANREYKGRYSTRLVRRRVCQVCDQEFAQTGRGRNAQTCDEHRGLRKITCKRCGGNAIVTNGGIAGFCSPACGSYYHLEQTGIDYLDEKTRKGRRRRLDRGTDGLGENQRRRLLDRWKAQQKSCSFCPALATTVDHVIPLSRGGTNFIGNLLPACKSCNSSRAYRYIMEWRVGKVVKLETIRKCHDTRSLPELR